MTPEEKAIVKAVDGYSDDILELTCRLVREPSTLGNEASAVTVMEKELNRLGYSPERIPIDPVKLNDHPGFAPVDWDYRENDGRDNLAAVVKAAGSGGRSALFNGHLDVVSPEPLSYWNHDPFDPVFRNGWIFGRGAGDMKSGIAAMVYAARAVEKAGFGLCANLTLETVIEEECCGNGALACLDAGYDADAVLIPEPFGPTILTSQVGVMWFRVEVSGKPRHVLEAGVGANAIEKCFPIIQALRDMEEEMNHTQVPDEYKGFNHPLNLNVGVIKGGDWPSTVAAFCGFECRMSFFPGMSYEQIREIIMNTVSQSAKQDPWLRQNPPAVKFFGFRSEGHTINPELPALSLLSGCHKDITGQVADRYIATCTTDLRAFVSYGKDQATCFGPIAENIHAENEKVNIDSIIHTARVYALFLARWCGLCS
ncbi:MAG: ArgE/DapE family deacylase [Desulfonatronovibrio sp.]